MRVDLSPQKMKYTDSDTKKKNDDVALFMFLSITLHFFIVLTVFKKSSCKYGHKKKAHFQKSISFLKFLFLKKILTLEVTMI
jgi:hypothetical protein